MSSHEEDVQGLFRCSPGKVVILFQIFISFGGTYLNAANMRTTFSCFRRTGVWPLDTDTNTDFHMLAQRSLRDLTRRHVRSQTASQGSETIRLSSDEILISAFLCQR